MILKQKTTAHEHEDFPRMNCKLLSSIKRNEDEELSEAILLNTISCSHSQLTNKFQIKNFTLINNKLNLNTIERRDF